MNIPKGYTDWFIGILNNGLLKSNDGFEHCSCKFISIPSEETGELFINIFQASIPTCFKITWLVVSTHLKNMLVKLDIFPK